jgi:DivIVA domain-containing protein
MSYQDGKDGFPLPGGTHEPPFELVLRGYDRRQVDAFLARIDVDLGTLAQDRDAAYAQLSALSTQVAQLQDELASSGRRSALPDAASYAAFGPRIEQIFALVEEQANDIRSSATDDADRLRAEAAALFEDARRDAKRVQEDFEITLSSRRIEAERDLAEKAERARSLTSEAATHASAVRADARKEADEVLTNARDEAQATLGAARSEAESTIVTAREKAERMVREARELAASIDTDARQQAAEAVERARVESDEVLRRVRAELKELAGQRQRITGQLSQMRELLGALAGSGTTNADDEFALEQLLGKLEREPAPPGEESGSRPAESSTTSAGVNTGPRPDDPTKPRPQQAGGVDHAASNGARTADGDRTANSDGPIGSERPVTPQADHERQSEARRMARIPVRPKRR